MALFQTKVLKDYLDKQDSKAIDKAYRTFTAYFQNSEVQRNIRSSKEEQFQATFLSKLFVDALGYTLFPDPKYNLTTEHKNETGAQKADGAILAGAKGGGGKAVAVIELKSTKTKDLESIRKQAFDYKANHTDCRYVITSNFEKLRFYINDAVEWLEFDLFHLSPADFATLYLCLHKNNLLNDVPQKVKDDSLVQEEKITKQLYKDYSLFRMELYRDLVKRNRRNPQLKELSEKSIKFTLFKKAQKLLDRFLFIFFAEDRGLIPRNMVVKINEEWEQLQNMQVDQSLYERYKIYFTNLDKGNPKHDIFAYNGGLFLPDPVLDTIEIDDDLLFKHTTTLTAYDFESEVDVNILGHIFENSLNEIESVAAEIEGVDFDKQKARRKKDGVFYTPKYITKYIVDNTLGKLCDEKKKELEITAEVYENAKQRSKKRLNNLQLYRDWLLQLTICDPACGSGAFLNQALEFLIAEHRYLDELSATYNKDALVLSDIENSILENNLYGVDLNQESVEIAKLSLWLRTAQRGRKLTSLSSNIKCGNSLIDAVKVAGDKAFKWEKEFPQVFAKGGFDVVIGNPPYVDLKGLLPEVTDYIFSRFTSSNNRINLYSSFIEKSTELLNKNGFFSFIIPSSLLTQDSYKELRKLILEKTSLTNIVRLPNESFGGSAGEVKVDTIILSFRINQSLNDDTEVLVYKGFDRISEISDYNADLHFYISPKTWLEEENYIYRINVNADTSQVIQKCQQSSLPLRECAEFCLGLTPYDKYKGHSQEQIKDRVFHSETQKDDTFKKLLAGNDITRYQVQWGGKEWISYGDWLGAPRAKHFFTSKRILVKQIIDWSDKRIWAALTEQELYNTQNAFNLIAKPEFRTEYLIAIINSKLMSFYHRKHFLEEYKDRFQKILIKDAKELPINPLSLANQQDFDKNVTKLIELQKELSNQNSNLIHLLLAKVPLAKITRGLQNWPSLDFKGFLKELQKAKVKLSLAEEAEWMPYFNQQKQQVQALQAQIDTLDKEIDQMVYALYGLTEEEIEVVENN